MILIGKNYVKAGLFDETHIEAIAISANPTKEKPAPAATPLTATINGAFILESLEIAPCRVVVTSFK